MNKILLRSTLKKLRQVPFDRSPYNVMVAPQEMLDFLAMMAGIKPVFLLGRGFDDPQWIEGVAAVARQNKFRVIKGPIWDAQSESTDLPPWFHEQMRALQSDQETAFYVSKAQSIADAAEASFEHPAIAMDEEARLLGYPPCCVRDHYRRQELLKRTVLTLAERTANGNLDEMKRLVREGVQMPVSTPEESAALEEATKLQPAPFTSFNMCNDCARDPSRPAGKISQQYKALVQIVDPALADEIAANALGLAS